MFNFQETMRRGVSFLEKLLFGKNSFYFPRGVNSDICYEAREEVQNLLIAVEDTWDRCTNNQNSQFALSILRVCPDFIPEHHARMAYKYLATGRYNNHNLNDETRDNSVLMHLYQVSKKFFLIQLFFKFFIIKIIQLIDVNLLFRFCRWRWISRVSRGYLGKTPIHCTISSETCACRQT